MRVYYQMALLGIEKFSEPNKNLMHLPNLPTTSLAQHLYIDSVAHGILMVVRDSVRNAVGRDNVRVHS